MNYSAENIGLWSPVIQLGIIAILVLISNILRLKIPLVKKNAYAYFCSGRLFTAGL